ncbi:MAG: group 1 truncated hemoglobin [Mariprofundales bacterium]|nr:group 1 truncated hemoglobin [Mariprofundales bacterium]
MHYSTFIPAFLIFIVLGLALPIILATIADANRGGAGDSGAAAPKSLFDRLGGEAAVNASVDIFYRKVLGDAFVAPFFEGVDMLKQASKQKTFLTLAFGGPTNYSGKDMREGHKHLVKRGLNDDHFEHILVHLRSTLAELGVADALIQEVIAVADSTRADVLDR